jgi:hypothetical protein
VSDPHIGAQWADGDPLAGFAAAIEAIERCRSGPMRCSSLAISPTTRPMLNTSRYTTSSPIEAPSYVLPGNHDDRALHRHFGVPGARRAVRTRSILARCVIVLDTTRQADPGASTARGWWLDAERGRASPADADRDAPPPARHRRRRGTTSACRWPPGARG